MTHEQLRKQLKAFERPYQRMELVSGDPGPLPLTKVGGAPWWPRGIARPTCVDGHQMGFVVQIRLDEVPGFAQPPSLLSFHYCDECTYDGKMPFGWKDIGHQRRYNVHVFANLTLEVDGLGIVAESSTAARIPTFYDGIESLSLEEIWAKFPTISGPGQLSGFEIVHQYGSKLGGWPGWMQHPEVPEDECGNEMKFVGQLAYEDSPRNSWCTGSVYLFVSDYDEHEDQQADMMIQTT
jgi:uncharacterized protein YwqG